ncbi:MAG: CinA family protein [Dehalococcoidales bacterium]|nr:CinA family protein [Dehalococcoidales bacterium]
MSVVEEEIGEMLRRRNMKLGAVESATGGLISHRITNIAGSSDYYEGSVTSYSNEIKINLIGVKKETIDRFGAVSAQTAEEMAAGAKNLLKADICISDTGIAGPGGATPEKPVGLFYIGLAHGNTVISRKHIFGNDREGNKQEAADTALRLLKEYLESID